MRPENFIIKYLDQIPLMQLATCEDDRPWVVNVYFAMDNEHNLYWVSQDTRRHSKEIAGNSFVAATIHRPYAVGQKGQAVSVEGSARAVPADEVDDLFQAYAERFGKYDLLPKLQDPGTPHRLYQLRPASFILYDEVNFPEEPRQAWVPDPLRSE